MWTLNFVPDFEGSIQIDGKKLPFSGMWDRVVYDTVDLHTVSIRSVDEEGSMLFRIVGTRHIREGRSESHRSRINLECLDVKF